MQGGLLIFAAFGSFVWGVAHAYQYWSPVLSGWVIFLVECLRDISWLMFIIGLLNYGDRKILPKNVVFSIYVVSALILAGGLFIEAYFESYTAHSPSNQIPLLGIIILSLFGLILVEQLYRNTRAASRNSFKLLVICLGMIFFYDIYSFSVKYILHDVDTHVWILRGLLNAAIVPVVALFARRHPELSTEIFVSRHVVFYTTSLIGTGLYLLTIAIGGYYIKIFGGEWGNLFQGVFLLTAAIILLFILTSSANRAKLKIFISKHFYENRYDYREEWMRLNNILSEQKDIEEVRKQVIVALTDILDSKGAQLWLKQEVGGYACVNSIAMPVSDILIDETENIISFLNQSNWVIDVDEYMYTPDIYNDLVIPRWLINLNDAWLVVPLKHRENLLGLVVILHPRISRKLNWEDRDLLKTVTDQVASYLALVTMTEELDRAYQFDAFNRLSAYVVHDLKNLVAQLGLVVANADKHRHNPAFIDDVITTVENAVAKMDRLLAQLRKDRFKRSNNNNIIINREIETSVSSLAKISPAPVFHDYRESIVLNIDGDRFSAIIEHLLRNAQEATEKTGKIDVYLSKSENNTALIDIVDTGHGMDMDFVQTRLFRPFDTTKGNAGMGIGVYEAKQFIQQLGGKINVESTPGKGTTFTIEIPIR